MTTRNMCILAAGRCQQTSDRADQCVKRHIHRVELLARSGSAEGFCPVEAVGSLARHQTARMCGDQEGGGGGVLYTL